MSDQSEYIADYSASLAEADRLRSIELQQKAEPPAPFADEILTEGDWTIFEEKGKYAHNHFAYFAINSKTGQSIELDVTGYHPISPDGFRRMVQMDFPKRSGPSPLHQADIDALFEAFSQERLSA